MIDVGEYLTKKGYSFTAVTRPSGVNYIMNCPFCDDREKKFAINAETGAYKCFHENNCGVKGSFYDFQKFHNDIPERLIKPNFNTIKPKVYIKPEVHGHKPSGKVLQWLSDRNLTEDAIKSFKLGMKNENTLMIPYFKQGELVNVKYRDINTKKMWSEKNTEPVLYNRDAISGTELTICEGELDAVSLAIYGVNAVSVPNGTNDLRWIENEWKWLEKFTKINLIMDNDPAGQKAVKEIVTRLGEWRCYNVVLPFKDANDCLKAGVSDKIILNCIETAKDFEMTNLTDTSYFIKAVKERVKNKNLGAESPFRGLDRMLKGFRDQELTVLSGNSGAGKSTLLNQFILTLARKGHKSCIASLEMPPVAYLEWMVRQESFEGQLTDRNIEDVLTKLADYVKIVDMDSVLTGKELFDYWEFAAKKYGVKFFFLDSLMRMELEGKTEYTGQKKLVSDLVTFSKKYKAHIFLVAHPRKGETDQKTPGKVDISGSADITNLAHNVLMLWRTTEEARKKAEDKGKTVADAVLYLRKNRTYGMEGRILLNFEYQTRLYQEVQ